MSMSNLFLFVMFKYSHFATYLKWILVADKNAVLFQDGLHSKKENEIFAVIVSTSEQLKRRPERPV